MAETPEERRARLNQELLDASLAAGPGTISRPGGSSFGRGGGGGGAPTIMPVEDGSYAGRAGRRGGAPMVGSNDRGRNNAVVGAGQNIVGSFNGDAIVGDAPAAAGGEAAAMRRAAITAQPGYVGRNLSASRGPSEEDRRRLYHDLVTVGRGSPSMRMALFQRFNDQANNAERGRNDMATTDLSATARGADNFADRQARSDLANQVDNRERDMFEGKMEIERANAMNMGDIVAMMAEDAKAKRENDQYGLERRGVQDKYDDDRIVELAASFEKAGMDPAAARQRAQESLAADLLESGQDLDTTGADAGARGIIRRSVDSLNRGTSFGQDIAELRMPTTNAVATDIDLDTVQTGERGGAVGFVNTFLPEKYELDNYYAEAPASKEGTQLRTTFQTAEELAEFERNLELGRKAQRARRRQQEGAE